MPLNRVKIKTKIKNKIIRPLLKEGFTMQKNNISCYRIRKDIVDVVSIQVGRGLGNFYLHSFVNLLINPEAKHLTSYHVGCRINNNPLKEHGWLGNWVSINEDEREIDLILDDISDVAGKVSLEYFDTVKGCRDYMLKIQENPNKPMFDYDEIICLSILGDSNKALSLCNTNTEKITNDEEFSDFEKREMINTLKAIEKSTHKNTLPELFEMWKYQAIEKIQNQ